MPGEPIHGKSFTIFDLAFAAAQPTAAGKQPEQVFMEAEAVAVARQEQRQAVAREEDVARTAFEQSLLAEKTRAQTEYAGAEGLDVHLRTWETGERQRFEDELVAWRQTNEQAFVTGVSTFLQQQPRITAPMMTGQAILETTYKHGNIFAVVAAAKAGVTSPSARYFARPDMVALQAQKFVAAQLVIDKQASEQEALSKFMEGPFTEQVQVLQPSSKGYHHPELVTYQTTKYASYAQTLFQYDPVKYPYVETAQWSKGRLETEVQTLGLGAGGFQAVTFEDLVTIAGLVINVGMIAKLSAGFLFPKVTTITGVHEVELTKSMGDALTSTRISTPITTTARVFRTTATELDDALRYITPEDILMGGMEKLTIRGGDDLIVTQRAADVMRVGQAPAFISAATTPPHLVVSQSAVTGNFMAGTRLAERSFTAVQMTAKIDPQVYLHFLRNVPVHVGQQWLPQMGGVTVSQLAQVPTVGLVMPAITKIALTESSVVPFASAGLSAAGLAKLFQPSKEPPITVSTPSRFEFTPMLSWLPSMADRPSRQAVPPFLSTSVRQFGISGSSSRVDPIASLKPFESSISTQKSSTSLKTVLSTPSIPTSFKPSMQRQHFDFTMPTGLGRRGAGRKRQPWDTYLWSYKVMTPTDVLKKVIG